MNTIQTRLHVHIHEAETILGAVAEAAADPGRGMECARARARQRRVHRHAGPEGRQRLRVPVRRQRQGCEPGEGVFPTIRGRPKGWTLPIRNIDVDVSTRKVKGLFYGALQAGEPSSPLSASTIATRSVCRQWGVDSVEEKKQRSTPIMWLQPTRMSAF